MEFRKKSVDGMSRNKPKVDGFVTNNPTLGAHNQQPNRVELGSPAKKLDGFNSQNQSLVFEKAIENRGALPQLNIDVDMSYEDSQKKKKNLGFGRTTTTRRVLKGVGIFFSAVAACGLLVGGFIFVKAWMTAHKVFQGGGKSSTLFSTDIKPEKLKGEGDGRINILLLGTGGGDHAGADLTDSIVIASIDPIAKDIALLSIPRDLWVTVPDYWTMKINAAYASAKNNVTDNGGTEQEAEEKGFATLEGVIKEYIGIPIHYHALVNFEAFADGVNALGGVDVNVENDLYDTFIMADNDNNPLIAKAGLQHFDGKRALLYAQSRYSTSDFDRGERQRILLIAIKEKIMTVGTFSNPKTVSKLIDALGDNVSINATLGEMMRMYEITKEIPSSSIVTVGLTDEANPLVTTGNVNGQSIVQPRAGLTDFSDIQSFVRNTLRDPFLKSENATIAVLNGSGIDGLATTKAEELKSYGYNVTVIDSAPTQNNEITVIYDKNNGEKKFTRNYLEQRLGVMTSKDGVPTDILATADFIVVLGKDANTQESN